MHEKILFLSFRKSTYDYFIKITKHIPSGNFEIIQTKKIFSVSLKGIKVLHKVDLEQARVFAVDEFVAKRGVFIPRLIINAYFLLLSYICFFRYYGAINKGYSKILIWGGGKFRQRIALQIATVCNVQIYYFENGLLPKTKVLDKKGINYNNSVPREREFYECYKGDLELPKELVPRVSKHVEKFNSQKEALPKKYIFVPFQVDYDTQIITNSPWIKNMRELFHVIQKIAVKSDYHFVLKEHPSSSINYPYLYKEVDKIHNVSFHNAYLTQELIENSSAVITVNSTVGVESLLFHKKVIVLGEAFYGIDGISLSVKSVDSLIDVINNLDSLEFNVRLVDNFLQYLYYDYLIFEDVHMHENFAKFLLGK